MTRPNPRSCCPYERKLGGRVGVGERPVDCAAVAGDEVPDVGERLGRERHAGAHERRPLHRGLPDERAGRTSPSRSLTTRSACSRAGVDVAVVERAIGDAGLGLDHPLRVENGRERSYSTSIDSRASSATERSRATTATGSPT